VESGRCQSALDCRRGAEFSRARQEQNGSGTASQWRRGDTGITSLEPLKGMKVYVEGASDKLLATMRVTEGIR
jgi:hypothetical protein